MFSAREFFVACAIVGSMALVGCQKTGAYETMELSPAPILEDEAMAHRGFDRSTVLYGNGTSQANPTLFPYTMSEDLPNYQQALVAPALFYGQALALPVTAILTPPWEETINRGVYVPPTYTAVPVTPRDARWFE